MKKYFIATAIVLTSGITAWSFNKKSDVPAEHIIKIEKAHLNQQAPGNTTHDIASAD